MDAVNAQFINKQIQYYFIYSMGIYKQVYKQNNPQPMGTHPYVLQMGFSTLQWMFQKIVTAKRLLFTGMFMQKIISGIVKASNCIISQICYNLYIKFK